MKEPQNGVEFEASLIQPITDFIDVKDKRIETLQETIKVMQENILILNETIKSQNETIKILMR
jgi:peptidoglycan hydrolase CwlO-like protein